MLKYRAAQNILLNTNKIFKQKFCGEILLPIFAIRKEKKFLSSLAKVAHLVEHDLAKVGVASSSLVFRSKKKVPQLRDFFSVAPVVELVDTQDLKSCSPQRE